MGSTSSSPAAWAATFATAAPVIEAPVAMPAADTTLSGTPADCADPRAVGESTEGFSGSADNGEPSATWRRERRSGD